MKISFIRFLVIRKLKRKLFRFIFRNLKYRRRTRKKVRRVRRWIRLLPFNILILLLKKRYFFAKRNKVNTRSLKPTLEEGPWRLDTTDVVEVQSVYDEMGLHTYWDRFRFRVVDRLRKHTLSTTFKGRWLRTYSGFQRLKTKLRKDRARPRVARYRRGWTKPTEYNFERLEWYDFGYQHYEILRQFWLYNYSGAKFRYFHVALPLLHKNLNRLTFSKHPFQRPYNYLTAIDILLRHPFRKTFRRKFLQRFKTLKQYFYDHLYLHHSFLHWHRNVSLYNVIMKHPRVAWVGFKQHKKLYKLNVIKAKIFATKNKLRILNMNYKIKCKQIEFRYQIKKGVLKYGLQVLLSLSILFIIYLSLI